MPSGIRRTITMFMLTFAMIISTISVAFATESTIIAGSNKKEIVQEYANENGVNSKLKKYLKEYKNQSNAAGKPVITVNGKTYYFESEEDVDKAYNAIQKESDSNKKIENLNEAVDNMVQPDTETGMTILSGFAGIINTFIGIMIVLITMFMTVFTALDICYIVFPAIRGWLDNSYESGGANSKTNADGSTSMRFVTDEAQYAVKQSDMGNTGQGGGGNPMMTYFKKRVVSYIVLAIMLFILLTGNITLITNLATKVVGGILEVLTSI